MTEPLCWTGAAFGLAVHSDFAIAGCPSEAPPADLPSTVLELTARADVAASVPVGGREVLSDRRDDRGRSVIRLVEHPDAGYLLGGTGHGLYHLTSGGDRVRCAPVAATPWRWQRFLVGSVLPLASTLAGREPLHAGAVAHAGGVVAFLGASGRGKSTLAALLALRGLDLVADDVLAVEARSGRAVVHPGAGLLMLRWPTVRALGADQVRRLGTRLGHSASGVRVARAVSHTPLPWTTAYLLEASDDGPIAASAARPDPRLLLGSTFVPVLRSRARLERQLDVAAVAARTVTFRTLRSPRGAALDEVADALLEDLAGLHLAGAP